MTYMFHMQAQGLQEGRPSETVLSVTLLFNEGRKVDIVGLAFLITSISYYIVDACP